MQGEVLLSSNPASIYPLIHGMIDILTAVSLNSLSSVTLNDTKLMQALTLLILYCTSVSLYWHFSTKIAPMDTCEGTKRGVTKCAQASLWKWRALSRLVLHPRNPNFISTMIKMKKKNFFFAFFLSRAFVNAITLREMLRIWPHSCSKTNFYLGTESDIVLEQRESWQQRRRGRKRAQTGLRLSCLNTETSHANMSCSCILSFWFGFFPWKRRVDFFTESDLNT